MTHPATFIITGVVVVAAAIFAIFTATKPQAQSYGKQRQETRYRPPSPPPSPPPPPSSARRRRRSPRRRSNSPIPCGAPATANEQPRTCSNCGNSPFINLNPCDHEVCKGCFVTNSENNITCPKCQSRIDSCTPPIPLYEKCKSCRKFTKVFKFLPCDHSLSLCISCFEEQRLGFAECPECNQKIQRSEPSYTTSGVCCFCDEFTQFERFQPCGHGIFCRRHALEYLTSGGEECTECGEPVTDF